MTAAAIQAGMQYPSVVRVLQDDSGVDNNSEYYYYDNGGELLSETRVPWDTFNDTEEDY